jgi:hypothetical protein
MPLEKSRTPLEQIITHLPSTIKKSVARLWKNHAHLWNKSSHTSPSRLKSPWHACGTFISGTIKHTTGTIIAHLWNKSSHTSIRNFCGHLRVFICASAIKKSVARLWNIHHLRNNHRTLRTPLVPVNPLATNFRYLALFPKLTHAYVYTERSRRDQRNY